MVDGHLSRHNNLYIRFDSATYTYSGVFNVETVSKKAVEEEKEKNAEKRSPIHLKVSGDGSWKKRGFTSLYDVTMLIGYYTGKVIDAR